MVGHYNSFIVRLWSDDRGRLHGTIEHVATRQSLVFLDLDAIPGFIRLRLSEPLTEPFIQSQVIPGPIDPDLEPSDEGESSDTDPSSAMDNSKFTDEAGI